MFNNLGGPTLLLILFIVLLLFGAPKLPALAKSLGQSMKILKKEVGGDGEKGDEKPAAESVAAESVAADASAQSASTAPSVEDELAKAKAEAAAARAEAEALRAAAEKRNEDDAKSGS